MPISFEPRQLTEQEARDYREYYFTEVFPDFEEVSAVYANLKEKLSGLSGRDIRDFHPVFWELYVYSTWFLLDRLSKEELKQAMVNQVVDAIRMNINVQNRFLEYFTLNVMDADEVESIYGDIKKNIFSSQTIVGADKQTGEKMSLGEAVAFLNRFAGQADSLRYVEFKTKLKNVMYSDYQPNDHTYIDPEVAVTRLINLLNFFIATDADEFIRAAYYHNKPLLLRQKEELASKKAPAQTDIKARSESEAETEAKPEAEMTEQAVTQTKKTTQKSPAKKMPPNQIKEMVKARFSKDKEGQFTNIEGVLTFLSDLADRYQDSSIAELYYFDERAGEFKWNEKINK